MNLDPVISFTFSLPNINGDNNYERERERERFGWRYDRATGI